MQHVVNRLVGSCQASEVPEEDRSGDMDRSARVVDFGDLHFFGGVSPEQCEENSCRVWSWSWGFNLVAPEGN